MQFPNVAVAVAVAVALDSKFCIKIFVTLTAKSAVEAKRKCTVDNDKRSGLLFMKD